MTRTHNTIDSGYLSAAVRAHPGDQTLLFLDGLELTGDPDCCQAVGYINVGVTLHDHEIRLVLRPGLQLPHPLEIGLPPTEADALARALHHNALYLDPSLDERGQL